MPFASREDYNAYMRKWYRRPENRQRMIDKRLKRYYEDPKHALELNRQARARDPERYNSYARKSMKKWYKKTLLILHANGTNFYRERKPPTRIWG